MKDGFAFQSEKKPQRLDLLDNDKSTLIFHAS